jgi:hypothetical protein
MYSKRWKKSMPKSELNKNLVTFNMRENMSFCLFVILSAQFAIFFHAGVSQMERFKFPVDKIIIPIEYGGIDMGMH